MQHNRLACPSCKQRSTKIVDTRGVASGLYVRRRHACASCGQRFTTNEVVVVDCIEADEEQWIRQLSGDPIEEPLGLPQYLKRRMKR